MRLTHEPIASDLVDMELIELKFIFDKSESPSLPYTDVPDQLAQSTMIIVTSTSSLAISLELREA